METDGDPTNEIPGSSMAFEVANHTVTEEPSPLDRVSFLIK